MMDEQMEFDDETLAIMSAYCGYDPRKRGMVSVEAFEEYGEKEWSLDAFLEAIQAAVETIPLNDRSTARVDLEGEGVACLKITYRRPETDEEVTTRVRRAFSYAKGTQASERRQYEALKRKFEGG